MRFFCGLFVSLLFFLLNPAYSTVSRRCTESVRLDGTGNLGNDSAPTFKLNDLSVKKCLKVDSATGCAGSYLKETSVEGRSGGLQSAMHRAKGSKEEDFGLEAKATSAQ